MKTKEDILKSWDWEIKHSQYLWNITAQEIYRVIASQPIQTAIDYFKQMRKKFRKLACSVYYLRAIRELKNLKVEGL